MGTNAIQSRLLSLLTDIAPDIDPGTVDPSRALRDQFDFDSMDALHFATAVSAAFGIEIAETDYLRLASLRGAEDFVSGRLAAGRKS